MAYSSIFMFCFSLHSDPPKMNQARWFLLAGFFLHFLPGWLFSCFCCFLYSFPPSPKLNMEVDGPSLWWLSFKFFLDGGSCQHVDSAFKAGPTSSYRLGRLWWLHDWFHPHLLSGCFLFLSFHSVLPASLFLSYPSPSCQQSLWSVGDFICDNL